jgi:hypothetical protein
MLNEVNNILSNPLVSQGLKLAAPEIMLGVQLLGNVGGIFKKKNSKIQGMIGAVDKRLAENLETLATTQSDALKAECEIRCHELLGILNLWSKL